MRLTARQRAFLDKLLDLYAEAREPLPYARVAEVLGVGRATAYDMLKLLESKGMVRAVYAVPDRPPGPGRASVLFEPAEAAHTLFARLAAEASRDDEWEDVKARVLASLEAGRAEDHEALMRDLLARAARAGSPLAYAGEIIAALLLALRRGRHGLGPRSPLGMLLDHTVGKPGLSMLAGLAFGLLAAQRRDDRPVGDLGAHIRRYEEAVQDLGPGEAQALRDFVGEVVGRLHPA